MTCPTTFVLQPRTNNETPYSQMWEADAFQQHYLTFFNKNYEAAQSQVHSRRLLYDLPGMENGLIMSRWFNPGI